MQNKVPFFKAFNNIFFGENVPMLLSSIKAIDVVLNPIFEFDIWYEIHVILFFYKI